MSIKYPDAYKRRTNQADEQLILLHADGINVNHIFKRTKSAIHSRGKTTIKTRI